MESDSAPTHPDSIERFRCALGSPYAGYDIFIVVCSTEAEARHRGESLSDLFSGVRTVCDSLGNRVVILSVVDRASRGQLAGQVLAWLEARKAAQDLGFDLDELLRTGRAKIAILHNGGRGERASPVTQSLRNSRGSQALVGGIVDANGRRKNLDLLSAVAVQVCDFAGTARGYVDTYWTSQLVFPMSPLNVDSNSGDSRRVLEKFAVRCDPKEAHARDFHDFGTLLLRGDGSVEKLIPNRDLAEKSGGTWRLREDRRGEWDRPDRELSFDFGSFRTRADFHLAWIEFGSKHWLAPGAEKRDIDPHFIAPLLHILSRIERAAIFLSRLPSAEKLRGDSSARGRELLSSTANEVSQTWNLPEHSSDALGFFLLHRDRPFFARPAETIGTLELGSKSLWLTFRRPIDIATEKLGMLADLSGHVISWSDGGESILADATPRDEERARSLRRFRSIENESIARFRVDGRMVQLGAEDLRSGVDVAGVRIESSVLQGDCVLLPGSRIVRSVLNDVRGCIHAEDSYLQSVTAREVRTKGSYLQSVVESRSLEAHNEIVCDVIRASLNDSRSPSGHARLRASINYDSRDRSGPETSATADQRTKTEGGRYTFDDVRNAEIDEAKDLSRERELRDDVERQFPSS